VEVVRETQEPPSEYEGGVHEEKEQKPKMAEGSRCKGKKEEPQK
jgi:hypothetical protein